jgi:hypothetical protein
VDLNSRFICYEDNSIADQREDFASKVDQSFLSKITRGQKVDNLYEKMKKMNNPSTFSHLIIAYFEISVGGRDYQIGSHIASSPTAVGCPSWTKESDSSLQGEKI